MEHIAWADESIRHKNMPFPTYFMCACIVDDNNQLRELMLSLNPIHANKLHWRNMTTKEKLHTLSSLSTLNSISLIVAAEQMNPTPAERARRSVLRRLLNNLEHFEIDQLILESRTPTQDNLDRQLLSYLRTNHTISSIRIDHIRGVNEPCLWLPDQVLGAYGDTRTHTLDCSEFITNKILDEYITL